MARCQSPALARAKVASARFEGYRAGCPGRIILPTVPRADPSQLPRLLRLTGKRRDEDGPAHNGENRAPVHRWCAVRSAIWIAASAGLGRLDQAAQLHCDLRFLDGIMALFGAPLAHVAGGGRLSLLDDCIRAPIGAADVDDCERYRLTVAQAGRRRDRRDGRAVARSRTDRPPAERASMIGEQVPDDRP